MDIDFSKYKFRPSRLKDLMTDSKEAITPLQLKKIDELSKKANLTDKQSAELERLIEKKNHGEVLSETAKLYLAEVYIKEAFGRDRDISNKFTEKGLYVEEDSLEIAGKHYKKLLIKNKDTFQNDFVIGTPDVILPDRVTDIKSSWDIWTFIKSAKTFKEYYWQLQAYMWLTGKNISDLAFCLSNAPRHIIDNEKYKASFTNKFEPGTPEFDELERALEEQVEKNMVFDDIPGELRIKVYQIDYHAKSIEKLKERIIEAREYLNNFNL